MRNFFIFIFLLVLLVGSVNASNLPIKLSYSLPSEDPTILIEKKSPLEIFAIIVPSQFSEGEDVQIVSKDLITWDLTCNDPYLVVEVYQNGNKIKGSSLDLARFVGNKNIGQFLITFNGLSTGTYGAIQYVWCNDPYSTFRSNNGCPYFPYLTESPVCKGYRESVSQRVSNVEESIEFKVESSSCVPQQEVCDNKDNDCDGKIDENNVCETGSNECNSGDTKCVGNNLEKCGNFDSDSYLEYGNSKTCELGCESLGLGSAQCKADDGGSGDGGGDEGGDDGGTEVNEPEIYYLGLPSVNLKDDSTPPAIKVGIRNTNDFSIIRKVEMEYISNNNKFYDTYLEELKKYNLLQSILNPTPEVAETSTCQGDEPQQAIIVKIPANSDITFWMNPAFPKTGSKFGGEDNYNLNGDYLLYVGAFKECGEGHTSLRGSIVTIKSTNNIIDEICDDGLDNNQDGYVDKNDDDCKNKKGQQISLTVEQIKKFTGEQLLKSLCSVNSECDNSNCVSQDFLDSEGIIIKSELKKRIKETSSTSSSIGWLITHFVKEVSNTIKDVDSLVGLVEEGKLGLCLDEGSGGGEINLGKYDPCSWGSRLVGNEDIGCFVGWGIIIFTILMFIIAFT